MYRVHAVCQLYHAVCLSLPVWSLVSASQPSINGIIAVEYEQTWELGERWRVGVGPCCLALKENP